MKQKKHQSDTLPMCALLAVVVVVVTGIALLSVSAEDWETRHRHAFKSASWFSPQ
jgi:type IV secretory pathway VirB2 component (pilin)